MANNQQKLTVFEAASDGDCMFSSIKYALDSIGKVYSIASLRNAIAQRALNENDIEFNSVLQSWHEMSHAIEESKISTGTICPLALQDVMHVYGILCQSSWPLEPNVRQFIYQRMMSREYWGDEISLRTLSQKLGVCFLVWDASSGAPYMPLINTTDDNVADKRTKSQIYIVLRLRGTDGGSHYDLYGCGPRFVFSSETLPENVKIAFRQFL